MEVGLLFDGLTKAVELLISPRVHIPWSWVILHVQSGSDCSVAPGFEGRCVLEGTHAWCIINGSRRLGTLTQLRQIGVAYLAQFELKFLTWVWVQTSVDLPTAIGLICLFTYASFWNQTQTTACK